MAAERLNDSNAACSRRTTPRPGTISAVRADVDDPAPVCTATDVPAGKLGHQQGSCPAVDRQVSIEVIRHRGGASEVDRPSPPLMPGTSAAVQLTVRSVVDQDLDWPERRLRPIEQPPYGRSGSARSSSPARGVQHAHRVGRALRRARRRLTRATSRPAHHPSRTAVRVLQPPPLPPFPRNSGRRWPRPERRTPRAVAAPMPRGLFPPVIRTTLSRSPGSIMQHPATSTYRHPSTGKSRSNRRP